MLQKTASYGNKPLLIKGIFPYDFNFYKETLYGVHCSNMFHFLSGQETYEVLKKIHESLMPGGKLYINTCSIYFHSFKHLFSYFVKKFRDGSDWPGEINNAHLQSLASPDRLPNFIHVHNKVSMIKILKRIGFKINKSFYCDLKPKAYASENKGVLAIIAEK
ncbi:hypothetical protein CDV26_08185 [Francisella halioticida]|uniref:Methyltransferase type 11 domain-containing protein n=1 Tax=Francisella halioticida TaxID=549298 RepID=A0ABN5AWS0_9GAMM|nr:hypothetical protein [Francisella halioticida]ASG68368.1 hypothetical protein CDV26_08185 [Francisella halioticida]